MAVHAHGCGGIRVGFWWMIDIIIIIVTIEAGIHHKGTLVRLPIIQR